MEHNGPVTDDPPATPARRPVLILIAIGLFSGFLSGMFGVGGGIVIVPALVMFTTLERRMAAGTSLVAIVPTSIAGVISYGVEGHVNVILAGILALGAVIGAQFGTWLLDRLPLPVIRWSFIAFLAVVAMGLFVTVPSRDGQFHLELLPIVGACVLGLVTGVLSGLLGVGGGIVVVPMLILLFGVSDLVAKGTSLLMMIPTAVSGTIGNLRRGNADWKSGLIVGGAACITASLGSLVSHLLDPAVANIIFAVFLVALNAQMSIRALRRKD